MQTSILQQKLENEAQKKFGDVPRKANNIGVICMQDEPYVDWAPSEL